MINPFDLSIGALAVIASVPFLQKHLDKKRHKEHEERKDKMIQDMKDNKTKVHKVKELPLIGDGHNVIFGTTRYGKTYATIHTLKQSKKGVLFFNMQHENMPPPFIKASSQNSWAQIKRSLKKGKKVNFLPRTDLNQAQKELALLVEKLYDGSMHDIFLVIDECHLYKKEALDACIRVATTGNRWGIRAVYISQRGAMVHNTLVSQSTNFIFFHENLSQKYWRDNYGIPVDTMFERIQARKYVFCQYDMTNTSPAMQVIP